MWRVPSYCGLRLRSWTYVQYATGDEELYDLQADPSELTNLSGKPELATIEHELRVALAEKMILDKDYLPIPALTPGEQTPPKAKKGKGKAGKAKAANGQ